MVEHTHIDTHAQTNTRLSLFTTGNEKRWPGGTTNPLPAYSKAAEVGVVETLSWFTDVTKNLAALHSSQAKDSTNQQLVQVVFFHNVLFGLQPLPLSYHIDYSHHLST